MMKATGLLIVALAYCAVALSFSPAHAADGALIDVTRNPGCGVKYKNKDDKVARNKRLAEYYFTGYLYSEQQKHGKHYHWADYDCRAKDATIRMGYGLAPEPPELAPAPVATNKPGSRAAQYEQDLMHDVFPDWGTVPGTLRIYPSENGAYFLMRFGGNTKDGERIEFWETDYIAVSDDGKITHWEGYNDTLAVDRLFRRVIGKGLKEIGTRENYHKILAERAKQSSEKGN
jgi:hypothetical protein